MADYTDLIAQVIGGGSGYNTDTGPIKSAGKFPGWRRIKMAGLLEGLGGIDRAISETQQGLPSGYAQIEQGEQRAKANVAQNTASRGLANTTVVDAMNRGVESDSSNARVSLEDMVRQRIASLRMARANFGMGTPAYGNPPQSRGNIFGNAFASALGNTLGGGNAGGAQGTGNWFGF